MQELSQEQKEKIDKMTQMEMARLYRFAKPGHPYFVYGTPVAIYFNEVFEKRGGITPEVSKLMGWEQ